MLLAMHKGNAPGGTGRFLPNISHLTWAAHGLLATENCPEGLASTHDIVRLCYHQQVELQALEPNGVVERVPARPNQKISYEPELVPRKPDPFEGTWEVLTVSESEPPFLDRHDVWGWRETSTRPPDLRGFRFDR